MAGHQLVFSGKHHAALQKHLIAKDGKEAAAILFCRSGAPLSDRLMVVDILPVPLGACAVREDVAITWPGEMLAKAIDRGEDEGLSLILIHSHPGGFFDFSATDDASDVLAIGSIFAGWSGDVPQAGHGSAIMIPTGQIKARLYDDRLVSDLVDRIWVIGDDIICWSGPEKAGLPLMAFGSDMTAMLGIMRAAIIGTSGTGSIMAEQAARMGFGKLILIDFDVVKEKNLNRILGTSAEDAKHERLKVEVIAAHIRTFRPDIEIEIVPENILTREAVIAAAGADLIFSCVDTSEGRQVADLVAQAFMIPLIDMGVTIPTRLRPDGTVAVSEVMGRIDYVQPGGATLFDREVYTPASLRAEYLARVDPERFEAERAEGYIKGAPEQAPSVIALNMRAASSAMLEFVARAFPFRHDENRQKTRTRFALADGEEEYFSEDSFDHGENVILGRGSTAPLLGIPALG